MHKRNTISTGFTIVELLIVVVVIAVLAAITMVAYTNFQNRAHDSAVQSDLSNFAKKLNLHEVELGQLVAGSISVGNATALPNFTFSPSKTSYGTVGNNLYYCSGEKDGRSTFTIAAESRSSNRFVYRSEEGYVKPIISGGLYAACVDGFDTGTAGYSYGYRSDSNQWQNWTNV